MWYLMYRMRVIVFKFIYIGRHVYWLPYTLRCLYFIVIRPFPSCHCLFSDNLLVVLICFTSLQSSSMKNYFYFDCYRCTVVIGQVLFILQHHIHQRDAIAGRFILRLHKTPFFFLLVYHSLDSSFSYHSLCSSCIYILWYI